MISTDEESHLDHRSRLSGSTIAWLFTEKAKQALDASEIGQLLEFLYNSSKIYQNLDGKVSIRLQTFYAAELLQSGESSTGLAPPFRPFNAPLGLVMHCQSKECDIGEFWDIESHSTQILAKQGLSKEFLFGFDWHWRREASARGRGSCPITQWTKPLQELHNALSCDWRFCHFRC